jgi:hypothetical protein
MFKVACPNGLLICIENTQRALGIVRGGVEGRPQKEP